MLLEYIVGATLPHPLHFALKFQLTFCRSLNQLQRRVCHTDDFAHNEHA